MSISIRIGLGVALLALAACSGGSKAGGAAGEALTDRDWELTAIGDRADPVGAGGKPVTLRLDSGDSHAGGFGGCNRYTGSFELNGDQVKFGPLASTKMACDPGTDVEDAYLPALGSVQSWEVANSVLVLKAAGVPVLRFRAAAR